MKGKCTKIAFFSQVNWHLQIFRHRIIFAQTWKRSTNRSLIQTFLAYLDKLNIPLPQGRFFGANSGEHHQRIKEQIYHELWVNPRKNWTTRKPILILRNRNSPNVSANPIGQMGLEMG